MKKSAWLRLALILVCAAMMLSLFACGGSTAAETEGSSKAPETEATEKKPDASETEKEETTETAPEADTEETESQEATTEKTVVPTETEKKPVETTEKEKPTETKEKETEPVAEPDPLDVFVKADALANASVNTGRIEKGVLSSDGKYVTFANKADGADGWMLGYTGGSVVSGQYLVIKYRFPVSNQTKATTIEIFCSTANAGPTGGDNVQLPVIADGEWHIGIVDMAKSKGAEKFPANSDGTYTIKYARFDVLNGSHKVGDTVDVAYVGIDNSLADALALVKAEGMKSAYVNVGYTAYKTYYASTGTTTPAPADVVNVFVTPDTLVGASVNASRFSGKELSADGSYVTFTANGTGGDGYALLYSGGATVSGQYIVFKYRYHAENAYKATYIETFISCTNGGPTGGDNLRFEVVSDGEWHIAVVDASALLKNFAANEDGTYTVKYARFDIFDVGSHGEGDKIDIAYVGLTDSIDNVVAANRDVKKVYHKLGNEAEKKYTIYTSTGTTEPGMTDVANKYFDAADLAGKAPSGTNIGKVELSEDKSYVSIYGKGAADGYFSVFGGNTDVTGQYLVMKYRYPTTNAEGYNPTTRPMYTGNVNAGPVGGDFTQSFPVVADGEWHMTVFNIAAHIKEDFLVANEDGTYTIKYFRFDVADGLPEDCCIDVAYIAFVDDAGLENVIAVAKGEGLETVTARLDATSGNVTYYTATGTTEPPVDDDETGTEVEGEETETETQTEGEIVEVNPDEEQGDVDYNVPFFQFNIDEINTVGVKGRSGAGTMYKDFAPYSTSIDGIIDLRGWFFGMSGVASYEFSIDGGATWITLPDTATNYTYGSDPDGIDKLIINKNTQLLGTPGFGVKAIFRDKASLKIDLSDLVDEKVSVTVSAVLNSGDRVEFLKLLDVFAACVHASVGEWDVVEGEYKLTADCQNCGKTIVMNCPHTDSKIVPVTEKGENGELYEEVVCNTCNYVNKRTVFYHNSIDAIYGGPDGTTVINPAERNNYQQTNGVNGAPESGYLTFDATGKLIDKDKNPIQVTNVFSFSGWLGVNGGVDRYVYKINDGAWLTPSGSAGTVGATSGIGKAIVGNAGIVDKTGSFKNASYQGKLKVMGMQEYADQTINITIGAVLANNPGTAADPNVIILAVVNNLYVTCIHADPANEWVKGATEGQIACVCVDCGETITKVCDHSVMDIEWDNDAKLYKGECVCGHIYENDVVYRAEAYVGAGAADSQNNFISAVKDGDVVRYTPTKSAGDPYFYPYRNGKAVTGKYMIVKYRLVNNGKNIGVSSPFASSVASGQGGAVGKNGDNQNFIFDSTLYADGNWHYMVITPRSGNNTFTANADGTYSWAYLRITTKSFAAYDGSCYLEIDEVAFVDNVNAAEHYAYSNDNNRAPFNLNLDDGNNTIDGGTFLGGAKATENASYAIDFSDKTLSTPKSLIIGGWLCTPGGVASYKYRVVSVNGETVAEPALVNWGTPGYRIDIYNAVGGPKGYSEACANGAGFKATLDFTAYEGKKINVEIVATTNFGTEVTIIVLNNITIPCSHAGNTNDFELRDGDMFRKVATCTDCGEDIYQNITTTTSGLRVWTPYELLKNAKTTSSTVTLQKEGTAPYIHIELGQDVKGEITTQINNGTVSNVGSYVAFLYRRNDKVNAQMQFFIGSGDLNGSSHKEVNSVANKWQYLVFDLSTLSKDWYNPDNGLKVLRLDTFNSTAHTKGAAVDLGFIAFFNSAEEAWNYFEAYKDEYNVTGIENPYTIHFDGVNTKLNNTAYIQSKGGTDTPIDIDYTDAVLNDAKSVTVGGWCVTPGGCVNFSYYIIDENGAKSERKLLVTSGNDAGDIRNEGLKRNFGESCGLGASSGGARVIDLTGYEGKQVDVQVVVCTNFGPEIVVSNLTNITVPAAE